MILRDDGNCDKLGIATRLRIVELSGGPCDGDEFGKFSSNGLFPGRDFRDEMSPLECNNGFWYLNEE